MVVEMKIEVLYEDNHLIIVNKPAGILVQAGDKDKPSLFDEVKKYLKDKYKKEGNVFLGLIHRLDRPVSGIVIFAKTSKGASRLSEQFRNREVKKIYTTLVEGEIKDPGHLVHFLKKDPESLKAVISGMEADGFQKSELSYVPILHTIYYSLLSVSLLTGRFNQIRAQFSHIGYPIVGDTLYGAKTKSRDKSICLCATEIEFKTATTNEVKKIKIDYPKDWDKVYT
jgi:23S rRNA pseudouridine1911/1915/1917 synthase